MESLKKREEINSNDKWDLTKLFKSEEIVDEYTLKIREYVDTILGMKGHILDNLSTLKEFLKVEKPLIVHKENGEYTDEILKIYNKM